MEPKKVITTLAVCFIELVGIADPQAFLCLLTTCLYPIIGVYRILEKTTWLQIVLYLYLFTLFLYFGVCKFHDKKGSVYKSLILLFATILLWRSTSFGHEYNLKEGILLICDIGLTTYFLLETIFALKELCKDDYEEIIPQEGFIEDIPNDNEDNDLGRIHVAETLAKRLISTKTSDESFAICINGEWGSGKTTFLKYLKEQIHAKSPNATLLNFTPWLSSSPEQIIKDFFISLRKSLKHDSSELNTDIRKYADILINTYKDPSNLLGILTTSSKADTSIEELRNQINERLSKIHHKIYIFIDDIDRLDNKEVLETLRLIRNTAKFSKLIYIVALDKIYVKNAIKSVLKDDNLSNRYIDKIFQLEFTLPKFEKGTIYFELVNILTSELKLSKRDKYEIRDEIFNAPKRDIHIDNYLSTFRDVKRYANLLLVAISQFFPDGKHNEEVSLRDLIWIEMVHYVDIGTYSTLSSTPYLLLNAKKLSEHGDTFFIYIEKEKEKPLTNNILKRLFPENLERQFDEKNSVRYQSNFDKYFALRPLDSQASRNEFIKLIQNHDESSMREWLLKQSNTKYNKAHSIYYLFLDEDIKDLDVEQQIFYTKFLFEFLRMFRVDNSDIGNLFMVKYADSNFRPNEKQHVKELLIKELKNFATDKEDCITEAKILSSMYPYSWISDYNEGEEIKFPICLLNTKDLEHLSIENFNKFVSFGEISSDELFNKQTRLCKLIENSYTWSQDSSKPHRVKNLIEKGLFKYTRSHFDVKDANKIMAHYKIAKSHDLYDTIPAEVHLTNKIKDCLGDVSFYVRFIINGLSDEGIDKYKYLKDNALSGYVQRNEN